MQYTIQKQFAFSASHQLTHLPPDHQCARLHGHNYRVELVLSSDRLNGSGFIRDYGELKPFKEYIDTQFDHRHLNDVIGTAEGTTAENLSRHFYNWCKQRWAELVCVRVSETPSTWAEVRADV
jgi:6-pyruvoyltetrahydropterin/6-carboxytetrahydropterin synthase